MSVMHVSTKLTIFQILTYSSVLVYCGNKTVINNTNLSTKPIDLSSSTLQQQALPTTLLDDSWKRDVYTNRTLRLDQDPLHVAYANRRKKMSIDNRYYIKKYNLQPLQQPNCSIDNKEVLCSSTSKTSTNNYDVITNNYHCCQDVYDCELCQLLKGYKTVEAIEVLNEIIKILENQDDLFANCDHENNNVDTTCILTTYYNSWKL